jgi:hypothetical protein
MQQQNIPAQIKELEDKKSKIDEKISSLTIQMNNESSKQEWIVIPTTDYEVTKNVIYKGKSYNEIIKLKKLEEELLTLKLIAIILENKELTKKLKMDGSSTNDDFFYKQPFQQNEEKGLVAGFYSGSGRSGLDSGYGPGDSCSYLGVRFVRKISKVKK